ncbi:MAG TPA: hypothetical protein PKN57_06635 [Saprospiraceae bacterium]|nr:hypothetical protein [Saprospiraceae bacterium]MCC6687636.1 hypothetical protein [Saprospiraceae bacterium]HMW75126.1 hypothetical protein [Saprospiraceae bacterium]HMX82941.1 hypothetical protein [Saprospiraceae bacterium]HMX86022.1 hypothetical protein [Saprospiraceae bacterium]
MNSKTFLVVGLLVFLFGACKKDSSTLPDIETAKAYLPLQIGSEWIYQTDSLIFSKTINSTKIDTSSYLIRYVMVDTFTNSAGELVFITDRYEKKTTDNNWNIKAVSGSFFSQNRFLITEGNNTFIKFSLPVAKGQRWDALALTNKEQTIEVGGEQIEIFKGWESRTVFADKEFDNGIQTYPECFKVELADVESLVELRNGYEVYAKNTGLVYSELRILDTQCGGNPAACDGIPWEQKAEKGFIVKQSLISYKK